MKGLSKTKHTQNTNTYRHRQRYDDSRGKGGWGGGGVAAKGGYMVMAGDLTLGGEHTILHMDDAI